MFESASQVAAQARAVSLIERVQAATRTENQAAAERLISMAELYLERARSYDGHEEWIIDLFEEVGAEIAAALRISTRKAAGLLHLALAIRQRLPKVGAVFESGELTLAEFQVIAYRTYLINDPAIMAVVDAKIALRVRRWPCLSKRKLAQAIDLIVSRVDRDAVRLAPQLTDGRYVHVDDGDNGVANVEARILDTTARALDQRLNHLADTVCPDDPRSREQRRADAIDALLAGADGMACECQSPDCPAQGRTTGGSNVVIHIVAEQATLNGTSDTPGSVSGSDSLIPADLLRKLASQARHLPIITPIDEPAEPRYTPSRHLADFIRCRDMSCRAPGCDQPAERCDIDHTVPYPKGPTHASNLKLLCRKHHLLKTFRGWRDEQLADGTVIWTLPDGTRYVTMPGSALLFPTLCVPTGTCPEPSVSTPPEESCTSRMTMMPTRRRTRAQNQAHSIAYERNLRVRIREREDAQRQAAWAAIRALPPDPDAEPPPF